MKKLSILFFVTLVILITTEVNAEKEKLPPIYHEKVYPTGDGPFPGIIVLHSSGGFRGSKSIIENFRSDVWIKAGYAWYA